MNEDQHHRRTDDVTTPPGTVVDVFPPAAWITNVDDGSRYGARAGVIISVVVICAILAVLWAAQGNSPWPCLAVVLCMFVAACISIPLSAEWGIRTERRNFERIRDRTAGATIARFCTLVRPILAFRNIAHLARRLRSIGPDGMVYRLLHEPSPIKPSPLNIPFEPIPLAVADPRFAALERSKETAWNKRESHLMDQVRGIANKNRRRAVLVVVAGLPGILLYGLTSGNWSGAAAAAAGVTLSAAMCVALSNRRSAPRHFIAAATIIHVRPSLIGGCTTLKVFQRADATMVILPHKSGLAFIGIADENQTHVLGCHPREADLLLRVWLSTASAPTRAQVASMFTSG